MKQGHKSNSLALGWNKIMRVRLNHGRNKIIRVMYWPIGLEHIHIFVDVFLRCSSVPRVDSLGRDKDERTDTRINADERKDERARGRMEGDGTRLGER